mmetsp:Transcript_11417/g.17206  ORF Transcript_11417/g.17206 Transcript_11417/m.17206 type:complete len:119 (+) Transcript_11417:119-475(+)
MAKVPQRPKMSSPAMLKNGPAPKPMAKSGMMLSQKPIRIQCQQDTPKVTADFNDFGDANDLKEYEIGFDIDEQLDSDDEFGPGGALSSSPRQGAEESKIERRPTRKRTAGVPEKTHSE